jgi:hypothetical protein
MPSCSYTERNATEETDMARKTAPPTCATAHLGCTCRGNVIAHNLHSINRMHVKITEAQTETCPKCNGAASSELLAIWGHCMSCQKASQAHLYGNFGR